MSFFNALNAGYSAEQIIEFLINSYPSLGKRIRSALNLGHDARNILNSFQGLDKKQLASLDERAKQNLTSSNPLVRGQEKTAQSSALNQFKQSAQAFPQAALGAGSAYLAAKALQGFPPQLNQEVIPPETPETLKPRINKHGFLDEGKGINLTPEEIAQSPIRNIFQQNPTTQTTSQVSPIQNSPETDAKNIIEQMNLDSRIKNLQNTGNSPEVIGQAIKTMLTPGQKTWLKSQTSMPIEEIVNEYIRSTPTTEKEKNIENVVGNMGSVPSERQAIREKESVSEPQKLEKNSLTSTQSGEIGEIKGISGTSALVEINGKTKQIPINDLMPEPEVVKKAKIVIDPLTIPEDLRSAALTFVSTPSSRSHVSVIFGPTKKIYTYRRKDGQPISEDIVKKLKEGTELPISSGETYMGAWNANNADSRGTSAYHELTQKSQKSTEPNDPSKEYIFEIDEAPFIHGYIDEFISALALLSKKFKGSSKRKKK